MDRKEVTSLKEFICIICPVGCKIKVDFELSSLSASGFASAPAIKSIHGFRCQRGEKYVQEEIINPKRTLTSVVSLKNGEMPMCPVRTSVPISKDILEEMTRNVSQLSVEAPVKIGEVLVKNIMGSGADIVVTRDLNRMIN